MRFFYDCEFLEDGRTIDLISIGIVDEAGSGFYYAINSEAPWDRVMAHPFLAEHVVPHLPKISRVPAAPGQAVADADRRYQIDQTVREVKPRWVIANEVRHFLLDRAGPAEPYAPIELWADHAAYDHVALAQLWGAMVDLPAGIPQYTRELRQFAADTGVLELPDRDPEAGAEHHALHDAAHCLALWRFIRRNAPTRPGGVAGHGLRPAPGPRHSTDPGPL